MDAVVAPPRAPTLSTALSAPLSSVTHLLSLLVPPLAVLGQLADRSDLVRSYTSAPVPSGDELQLSRTTFLKRQLGLVQHAVAQTLWLDWSQELEREELGLAQVVLGRWLVPIPFEGDSATATELAKSSYGILLAALSRRESAPKLIDLVVDFLERLARTYNVKQLYLHIYGSALGDERERTFASGRWETALKNLVSVPARVANACGDAAIKTQTRVGVNIPDGLVWTKYLALLSCSFEDLVWHLASLESSTKAEQDAESLSAPLHSLVLNDFLSASPSAPSLFASIMPLLVSHLLPPPFPAPASQLVRRARYAELWRLSFEELSQRDTAKLATCFLRILESSELKGVLWATGAEELGRIKATTFLLSELFGPLDSRGDTLAWRTFVPLLVDSSTTWSVGLTRVLVFWGHVSFAAEPERHECMRQLLKQTMGQWCSIEGIQNGSEGGRVHLSTLALLAIHALPPLDPTVVDLSRSPPFLNAIHAHLTLLRPRTRLLGMLTAELVSTRSIPVGGAMAALSFGDIWDGDDEDRVLVRELRAMVARPAEAMEKFEGWQKGLLKRWTGQTTAVVAPRSSTVRIATTVVSTPALAAPSKRPLIFIIDDPDDLKPYPLPPGPSAAYLETLQSEDASLYATAMPSASSQTSATRRMGKLRAPVYIPELAAYLKGKAPEGGDTKVDEEAERVEMGLREGENLIRRKKGWGGELVENAVDLTFAVMGLQDPFEIDNFDQLKQNLLIALVACCPRQAAPTIIEQYFFHQYSIAQRHTMLTALALGAREIAGFSPPVAGKITGAHSPATSTPAIKLFPSNKFSPSVHRQLLAAEQGPSAISARSLPLGALDQITAELTKTALTDAREEAEVSIPEAAREKLLTVRRFASAKTKDAALGKVAPAPTKDDLNSLAAEYFVMPLINRFWLFLRDTATSPARSNGGYVGGGGSSSLLEPITLSNYLGTLAVLLHASRHSAHFLAVLAPETIELTLSLRTTPDSTDDVVLAGVMELLLVVLDATVAQDYGRSLVRLSKGVGLVGDVKEWSEELFEYEERKGRVGRTGRAAAGVLLRIEEILSRWRGIAGY